MRKTPKKALRLRVPMVKRFLDFVAEREHVRTQRAAGKPAPWTDDPILQRYKFTNVHREHDRVTIWIDEHIRKPYKDHTNLWFMLCAARQINWPDTMEELMREGAWPGDMRKGISKEQYRPDWLRAAMRKRQRRGDKLYTGAYMINAQYGKETQLASDKAYFTAYLTLGPLWKHRNAAERALHGTLAEAHAWLSQFRGWGDFLTAQVIADLKHTRYLRNASDWMDWAVLGPGSTRGLNRLLGATSRKERKHPFHDDVALELLKKLRREDAVLKSLCLQDLQNCLCEFDKYERARLGEGRPRATFNGTGKE